MTTSTQIAIRKLPGYEEDIKKDILAGAKSLYEHLGFKSAEYPEIMPLAECLYMVKYHD